MARNSGAQQCASCGVNALLTDTTGRIAARFAVVRGQTRMTECRCNAPLKIAKTFQLSNGGLEVCVMDASPGLLDGDAYAFDWHLDSGASVRLTTQGFARAHPTRGHGARVETRITIEDGARLEMVPQPLLLFAGAALSVEQEAEIAPDATLLSGEIIGAGRTARGEAFAFERFENRVRVRRQGVPLYVSHNTTRPLQLNPRRLGAWGDFTHRANVWMFGPRADAAMCERWRELLSAGAQQFPDDDAHHQAASNPTWSGVSLLARGGVMASLLGQSAWELQQAARQLYDAARAAQSDAAS